MILVQFEYTMHVYIYYCKAFVITVSTQIVHFVLITNIKFWWSNLVQITSFEHFFSFIYIYTYITYYIYTTIIKSSTGCSWKISMQRNWTERDSYYRSYYKFLYMHYLLNWSKIFSTINNHSIAANICSLDIIINELSEGVQLFCLCYWQLYCSIES
jgi:hypothetical protein